MKLRRGVRHGKAATRKGIGSSLYEGAKPG